MSEIPEIVIREEWALPLARVEAFFLAQSDVQVLGKGCFRCGGCLVALCALPERRLGSLTLPRLSLEYRGKDAEKEAKKQRKRERLALRKNKLKEMIRKRWEWFCNATHKLFNWCKRKKKIVLPSATLLIILIVGSWIFFSMYWLNAEEKLAYKNALYLRERMRDPDSFRLYDNNMFVIKNEVQGNIVVFKYGAANVYNAILTKEAIFSGHDYLIDSEDEVSDTIFDSKKREKIYAIKLIIAGCNYATTWSNIHFTKEAIEEYNIKRGKDPKCRQDINVRKIKRKMGIK